MAQSLADVKEGGPLTGGDGGKGVAQAVEGEAGQVVPAHKAGEGQGQGIGGVGAVLVVQHHVALGVEVVRILAAQGLLAALLLFQKQIELIGQIQGAHGRAIFGLLLDDVGPVGGAGLPDDDQAALKVHVVPLQAADLLPAHPQAARQLHRQLQRLSLDELVEALKLQVVVEGGLLGPGTGGLHPVHRGDRDHLLAHRRAQGAGEQVVVAAHGVGGQVGLPLGGGVVLLDLFGAELGEGRIAQGGVDVVINDFLVGIYRGLRPVGTHDGVHPILQPLGQGHLLGGDKLGLLPGGEKFFQAVAGGSQGRKGAVLFDPLAVFIPSQIHTDIVEVAYVVI